MGLNHHLYVIGDQVAGGQDVVHSVVPLGNAVTGGDDTELHGSAPCLANPLFCIIRDQVQIIVTWDCAVPGVGDADKGPLQIIIAIPHGLVESALKGPLGALQDIFAAPDHGNSSFKSDFLPLNTTNVVKVKKGLYFGAPLPQHVKAERLEDGSQGQG